MGYISLKGIIISSAPYKEKDRILTIFTDQMGKIRAKIRSVRSTNSKRSGLSDEFLYEKLMLYRKRDFFTITEAELLSAFLEAKSHIENYTALLYIKELVTLFTSYEQEDMRIFNLLLNVLYALREKDLSDVATVYFILHFLRYSGNPIKLTNATSNKIFFNAKEGGFTNDEGIRVKKEVMEEIALLYSQDVNEIEPTKNERLILDLLNNFIFYHTNSRHFTEFLETIGKLANI